MKYALTNQFPNDLIYDEQGPFISIYMPTHRQTPDNKKDILVFKNAVKEVEQSLNQAYDKNAIKDLLTLFSDLEHDKMFWNHSLDGLAILANLEKCIIYRLQKSIKKLVVVSDSLHIKPLVSIYQSKKSYQLLGLSGNEFSLYTGDQYELKPIELEKGIPRTIEDVLGKQHTDSYLTHGTYGGVGKQNMIYHGHGGEKDDVEIDNEKFFRYIDKFVLEKYSRVSKVPLILVSLKEYHHPFMKISNNPYLLKKAIRGSYQAMDLNQLLSSAWEIIEEIEHSKHEKMIEQYKSAEANSLGSDNLKDVVKAAYENRVHSLLIEEGRIIPGKIDQKNGTVKLGNLDDPKVDDIIDDLTEYVLKKRGDIVMLSHEMMPTQTGIAAIYRY